MCGKSIARNVDIASVVEGYGTRAIITQAAQKRGIAQYRVDNQWQSGIVRADCEADRLRISFLITAANLDSFLANHLIYGGTRLANPVVT